MEILLDARIEINVIIAERQIAKVLKSNLLSSAHHIFLSGEKMPLYGEREIKWKGPFRVIEFDDDKLVTV